MAVSSAEDEAGSIERALDGMRRFAVVGASANPDRPSYGVMRALIALGLDVTPVNPALAGQALLGRTVVGTLAEAVPLDLVDVFRASDQAGAVVDEAVRLGARAVWLQLGVRDDAAVARARAAGVHAVQDHCLKVELGRRGRPQS